MLEKKDGYWLSPFSSSEALKRILSEVERNNVKIMCDAELPFRHPQLFLRLDDFFYNQKIFPEKMVIILLPASI